ncbi:MAG: sensor histidine kinase [Actinomycetota bacterium]
MDTAHARAEAALRRDATLEAVAFAAQRFLLDADWEALVPQVLRRLGEATGVSRVYLFENRANGEGLRRELRGQWVASEDLARVEVGTELGFDGLDRWVTMLGRGDVVHGTVADLPPSERPTLERHGIRSILLAPVPGAEGWWGYLGFDDCVDERVWSQVEIDALRAAAGTLGAAIQRERSERLVREAEARFRDLVEHIPAVTYRESVDADPELFYVSPQVTQVFGYRPEEWTWGPGFWDEHLHPEDRERVRALDRRTNESGEPFSTEYRFRRADGTYAWIQDQATLVGSEGGRPFWQGFMLDVTERREAEAALAEAEARYRSLVEQVPVVIYTQAVDPDDPRITRTVYIGPRTEQMIGYTVDEVLSTGRLWSQILHPEDRDRVLAAGAAGNLSGESFAMEYRVIAKDGRVVWVHDEATVARDADGRPRLWQGFMLDITERKEAEERLEQALAVERDAGRRLRSLDEMKNTFLQAVSHDLRTPLAAILGLAVTLERADIELPQDETRDLARRIAANARKLDRMVTDLLDLDRLARGIVEPKLYPTDVGELVARVVRESELMAQRRVAVDAPAFVVDVDASKLERILENLLANTLRHTPAGTPVSVGVRRSESGMLLTVEDEGGGVREDMREAIFEPFRQGPEATEHAPGAGVGLTLVRRFAELHGGWAWVEERAGGGASFRVFLPGVTSPGVAPPGIASAD